MYYSGRVRRQSQVFSVQLPEPRKYNDNLVAFIYGGVDVADKVFDDGSVRL